MDLSKLTKAELLLKCAELGLTKYKSKTIADLRLLIQNNTPVTSTKTRFIIENDSDDDTDDMSEDFIENIIDEDIPIQKIDLSGYKFIDLFCGIGGFHQALHKLGATCVLSCDIDKDCRVVYKENYGIEPVSNVKDIDETNMEDFDILCAGFPCFVAGTQILTNNGYKNIEDVLKIDALLTHTGQFQTILNRQTKIYNGDIFDLKIHYHPEVISTTEEHPFYVREKLLHNNEYVFGEPKWKPASKLTMNDYFGMVINSNEIIPKFKTDKYYIILDKLDYWFVMGYLFADDDGNVFDCDAFQKIHTDTNFMLFFVRFSTYAYSATIPEWIQDAPKEYIKVFIDGYMSASNGGNIYMLPKLIYSLQRLYLKLGYIFYKKKEQHTSYFIEGNYAWFEPLQITKRETNGIEQIVYNFEVENDNSYVVANICVHNCQAFSNGGKKKCFEDKRGLLFDEIIRIAKVKKPRFMFLENVKHILKVSNGDVIKYIKTQIAMIGYTLQLFQISPHNFGIPQQRERVYFVCVRNDIYNGSDIVLPTYLGKLDFNKFLDKKEEIDEKYFIKGDTLHVLEAWDIMIKQFQVSEKISPTIMMNDAFKIYTPSEFSEFPDWKQEYITKNKPLIEKYNSQFKKWYDENAALLQKREIYGKLEWQTGPIKENDSIFNHFIQIRQSGIRVKKGHYFPTLVAISQIPIYGKEKRYITPRECARLQSFPETFKLSPDDKKSYKQLGNSVNVDNVYTVISSTLQKYV